MRNTTGFAAVILAAIYLVLPVRAEEPYRLVKTITLGAPDRWDYAVFEAGRIYIAHGDRMTVVDAEKGAVAGEVTGLSGGAHGFAAYGGKGYADDGKAGTVAVFDLKTLKVVKTIKAEEDADGIVFDSVSEHIFVIDGDSGKLTVIDPKTDSVVATIAGGGGLEFGVSGGNGKFYVDGAEKGEIVRIDVKTNKADAHWPLAGCIKPHGLAIDRAAHRLFASCASKVMAVVNADTGAVMAELPIGEGTDFAEFDPGRKRAFSSNRDGTLSIIAERDDAHFEALAPLATAYGARTMGIDVKTGRLYLVTADFATNETTDDARHRYAVKPGTAKLLVFEPAQ